MPNDAPLTVLIDGECAICTREARHLQKLDRGRDRIRIVDVRSPDFDPGQLGLTEEAVMGRIHGVTEDGDILTGMDVLRRAYRELGYGCLLAPTGWPVLRGVFDRLYMWIARNRMRLSGALTRCEKHACDVCAPSGRPRGQKKGPPSDGP